MKSMGNLKHNILSLITISFLWNCNTNIADLKGEMALPVTEVVNTDSVVKDAFDSSEVSVNSNATAAQYLVGTWLVEERISDGLSKQGDQNVFAIYNEDSSFSMSAINVKGKWWVSDTFLFQKYPNTQKFSVDTTVIKKLNDSVLEVSEMKRNQKFVFKKVSK